MNFDLQPHDSTTLRRQGAVLQILVSAKGARFQRPSRAPRVVPRRTARAASRTATAPCRSSEWPPVVDGCDQPTGDAALLARLSQERVEEFNRRSDVVMSDTAETARESTIWRRRTLKSLARLSTLQVWSDEPERGSASEKHPLGDAAK